MADRDRAGQRKVRLMSAWVMVGVVLMVLGAVTTLWISFLGAAVIGSTPVFFTLRAALAPRRAATKQRPAPPQRPASRRRAASPRRRGHG
jgi:hypothetical protein